MGRDRRYFLLPMRHFETEIKLEVPNSRALKRRLRDLGFSMLRPRHFERNILFDYPDQRLRRARCLLRLRFVNGRSLLTFKGAPLRARQYKVRREIDLEVGDGAGLEEILRALGLRGVFRYEKYRTDFAPAKSAPKARALALVYDETPIGDYVELEGSRRSIDRMARRLGYAKRDYIPASYAALYREKCLAQGKTPGDMVFPKN